MSAIVVCPLYKTILKSYIRQFGVVQVRGRIVNMYIMNSIVKIEFLLSFLNDQTKFLTCDSQAKIMVYPTLPICTSFLLLCILITVAPSDMLSCEHPSW